MAASAAAAAAAAAAAWEWQRRPRPLQLLRRAHQPVLPLHQGQQHAERGRVAASCRFLQTWCHAEHEHHETGTLIKLCTWHAPSSGAACSHLDQQAVQDVGALHDAPRRATTHRPTPAAAAGTLIRLHSMHACTPFAAALHSRTLIRLCRMWASCMIPWRMWYSSAASSLCSDCSHQGRRGQSWGEPARGKSWEEPARGKSWGAVQCSPAQPNQGMGWFCVLQPRRCHNVPFWSLHTTYTAP